jgi:hypothetical protein
LDPRERKEQQKEENSLVRSFVKCGIGVEETRNGYKILVKNLKGSVQFDDLGMDGMLLRRLLDN